MGAPFASRPRRSVLVGPGAPFRPGRRVLVANAPLLFDLCFQQEKQQEIYVRRGGARMRQDVPDARYVVGRCW